MQELQQTQTKSSKAGRFTHHLISVCAPKYPCNIYFCCKMAINHARYARHMAFTFRKSFKVAPGLSLNVSKRGMGVSVGGRNTPRATINSSGRLTKSLRLAPGLRYQTTSTIGKKKAAKRAASKIQPTDVQTEQSQQNQSPTADTAQPREPRNLFLPHSFWSVLFFSLAGFISATQESYDKVAFFILALAVVFGLTYVWNLISRDEQ
jgi:hypothetical protein